MMPWPTVLVLCLLCVALGMILTKLVLLQPARRPERRARCGDCGGVEPDCAGNCTGFPPESAA